MSCKNFNLIHVFLFLSLFVHGFGVFNGSMSAKYSSFCRRGVVYVGLPWDCSGFIQCTPATGGRFLAVWIPCSGNLQYDHNQQVCVYGKGSCSNLPKVAEEKCPRYPDLKFLHPESCAMFYDCRQKTPINGMKIYENECPYPKVFHQEAQACWPKYLVKCGKRPIPSTKCDYRLACKADICNGKTAGSYPVPGREFAKEYIVCENNSISEKGVCLANDEVFDPIQGKCSNKYEQSVSTYCQKNPMKLFEDMSKCSLYYDCSKVTHHKALKAYQTECKYTHLFDPQDKTCKLYNEVICEDKPEPKQPCEYSVGHCYDRPECISCDAKCDPADIGQFAHTGDPSKIITCKDGRTIDIKTCPLGKSFDSTTKQCEKACTCDAEIRALALAMKNIQNFLAPKGLPVMTCDKPLENILKQTKQTTEVGSGVLSCKTSYKVCPVHKSLTCAAGLIFGSWTGTNQQQCVMSHFTDSNGLTSPLAVPCGDPINGSIAITVMSVGGSLPEILSLRNGNDVLIELIFDLSTSKLTQKSKQSNVHGPHKVEDLPANLKIVTNVNFLLTIFFDAGGLRGEVGSSSNTVLLFQNYPYKFKPDTVKSFNWNSALKVTELEFKY